MPTGTDEIMCGHRSITNGGRIFVCTKPLHNDDRHFYERSDHHTHDVLSELASAERTAMPELESSLEKFFRERVRLLGGMAIKMTPTEAGLPDRMVVMPGGHIFLCELKTDTGRVSPIQKVKHARLEKLGVQVHVLSGRAGILTFLRSVVEALGPQNTRKSAR